MIGTVVNVVTAKAAEGIEDAVEAGWKAWERHREGKAEGERKKEEEEGRRRR